MAYIEFRNVKKYYQQGEIEVRALDGMEFDIEKGEFCVIVGPSGSGKSTLLNILGGMDRATDGTVRLAGKEITSYRKKELTAFRRDAVGFVFQFYNLVQNLTALENIELATEICKDSLDAGTVLSKVGLTDRADNFPSQLSGGEQQRVSIARALAKNPDIILCDEPTGALDDQTGKAILTLLYDTCKTMEKTVVIITHNSAFTQVADRVIKIRNGRMVEMTVNPSPMPIEGLEW